MACFGMGATGSKEEIAKNKQIESEIAKLKNKPPDIKILLLGAGESGKSTVAKQMKIIHSITGFTKEEQLYYKKMIAQNVVTAMVVLLQQAKKRNIDLTAENEEKASAFLAEFEQSHHKFRGPLTSEIADTVESLWKDPGVQAAYEKRNEYLLSESAAIFLNNVKTYVPEEYLPTQQDILHVRVKTTGIQETLFVLQKKRFRMVDVGGQRNERKKWIHCFEDVTVIIFCVSLNAYDRVLEEDNTVNRMHESLSLFKEIINNEWFFNIPIILFLNKKDLFEEKVKTVDLKCCFPQYDGGCDYDKASKYIEEKFLAQNENSSRTIFPSKTCATNTENIKFVFKACQNIIMNAIISNIF